MTQQSVLPMIYFRVIIAATCRNQEDVKRALQGTQITFHTRQTIQEGVRIEDYRKFLRNVKSICSSPFAILDAGAVCPITAHGALSHAISCSPDRMTALTVITRYAKLRGYFCNFYITNRNNKTRLQIRIDPILGEEADDALDFILAAFLKQLMFRDLVPLTPPVIELTRPEPKISVTQHYQNVLGASIVYGQSENCIVFETEELEQPLPTYDRELFELAEEKCQRLFSNIQNPASTKEAIERVFEVHPGVIWTTEQVAEQLKISPRTMQRRLQKENTNFQEVFDHWMKKLTHNYMSEQNLTVEVIASLLGYSDEANFRRAFKRWHGCTPQSYKEKHVISA